MDEGNVRISEHVRQHGLGIPRASAWTRLIQPTTKDPAVGRVSAHHTASVGERRRITRSGRSDAWLVVNEHRPHLVIRAGLGTGLGRPPAQRRVRHQRHPLCWLALAQAAPQRRPAVRVNKPDRRVARVIADAKLGQDVGRDGSDLKAGLLVSNGGHETMITIRNVVVWRESDSKFAAVGVSAVPRRAGWPGPEESGFSPSVTGDRLSRVVARRSPPGCRSDSQSRSAAYAKSSFAGSERSGPGDPVPIPNLVIASAGPTGCGRR